MRLATFRIKATTSAARRTVRPSKASGARARVVDGAFEGANSNVAFIIVFFRAGIFKGKPGFSPIFIEIFYFFYSKRLRRPAFFGERAGVEAENGRFAGACRFEKSLYIVLARRRGAEPVDRRLATRGEGVAKIEKRLEYVERGKNDASRSTVGAEERVAAVEFGAGQNAARKGAGDVASRRRVDASRRLASWGVGAASWVRDRSRFGGGRRRRGVSGGDERGESGFRGGLRDRFSLVSSFFTGGRFGDRRSLQRGATFGRRGDGSRRRVVDFGEKGVSLVGPVDFFDVDADATLRRVGGARGGGAAVGRLRRAWGRATFSFGRGGAEDRDTLRNERRVRGGFWNAVGGDGFRVGDRLRRRRLLSGAFTGVARGVGRERDPGVAGVEAVLLRAARFSGNVGRVDWEDASFGRVLRSGLRFLLRGGSEDDAVVFRSISKRLFSRCFRGVLRYRRDASSRDERVQRDGNRARRGGVGGAGRSDRVLLEDDFDRADAGRRVQRGRDRAGFRRRRVVRLRRRVVVGDRSDARGRVGNDRRFLRRDELSVDVDRVERRTLWGAKRGSVRDRLRRRVRDFRARRVVPESAGAVLENRVRKGRRPNDEGVKERKKSRKKSRERGKLGKNRALKNSENLLKR